MTHPGARLKAALEAGEFILAPGVYDMFSALVAERMAFPALYMTGYGVSGSLLGRPDAGLVSYRDMVERARTIAAGTAKPLIADADTGFGGLLNIRETVRGYEAAGVAAIQIEDQESPKRCGHTAGRRVVPIEDMVRRVEVAVDARRSGDTLIVARTDARTSHGLGEAIRRARAYRAAGADILFVEAPESEAEFAEVGAALAGEGGWLLANMVPSGRSPDLGRDRLKALGFSLAIYPSAAMTVATAAIRAAFGHLLSHGSMTGSPQPALAMAELHDLVGFPEVWDFEKRFPEADRWTSADEERRRP